MRILVISRSEWSDSNSIGTTLSSLFGNFDSGDIANLYFRTARPYNQVCKSYFSLTEFMALHGGGKEFLLDLTKQGDPLGATTSYAPKAIELEKNLLSLFRGGFSYLPNLVQDLFWRIKWWKSKSLNSFLDNFAPQVIFFPSFSAPYTHRVARYISKYSGAKLVTFHADDYIFQRAGIGAPLKAAYYSILRKEIAKTVRRSAINYAISPSLRDGYAYFFNQPFFLLSKGCVTTRKRPSSSDIEKKLIAIRRENVIKCVYIGSLQYGRWKTLELLVDAMKRVGDDGGVKFELKIYSQYSIKKEVLNRISCPGTSEFLGALPADRVAEIIGNSDLVLHVESFDESDIQSTRYSFSTKILDCLASATPVLAIGPSGISSMDFLSSSDIASTITDKAKIGESLNKIRYSIGNLLMLGIAAYDYCLENHSAEMIRAKLKKDIYEII